MSRSIRMRLVVAAASAAIVLPVLVPSTAMARPSALNLSKFCSTITKAQAAKILAHKVDVVQAIVGGANAVCVYEVNGSTTAAYVSVYQHTSPKAFAGIEQLAKKQFKGTVITTFKGYPAYRLVVKQTASTTSNRLIILKGTNMLSVGSSISSMASVNTLAAAFIKAV